MLLGDDILADPPPALPGGEEIGRTRGGRPVLGYRLGDGPSHVSLIAGCHADEPVGPELLRRLVATLVASRSPVPILRRCTLWVVPDANPDGAEANRPWTDVTRDCTDSGGHADRGYDLALYLERAVRELPGDDVEFGFPAAADDAEARPETRAIASFLAAGAPFALHASLHGMGLALGPWFLVEPFWLARTAPLRQRLAARVAELGYRLHDVDRGGEKGFWRIAPGFATRPDSRAMRDHFLASGDRAIAARFRPSSMELVRSLGGDPLTLVTEMPLFLLPAEGPLAEHEERLTRHLRLQRAVAEHGAAAADRLGIRPMPVRDQMRLQLAFVEAGLALVLDEGGGRPRDDLPVR